MESTRVVEAILIQQILREKCPCFSGTSLGDHAEPWHAARFVPGYTGCQRGTVSCRWALERQSVDSDTSLVPTFKLSTKSVWHVRETHETARAREIRRIAELRAGPLDGHKADRTHNKTRFARWAEVLWRLPSGERTSGQIALSGSCTGSGHLRAKCLTC